MGDETVKSEDLKHLWNQLRDDLGDPGAGDMTETLLGEEAKVDWRTLEEGRLPRPAFLDEVQRFYCREAERLRREGNFYEARWCREVAFLAGRILAQRDKQEERGEEQPQAQ